MSYSSPTQSSSLRYARVKEDLERKASFSEWRRNGSASPTRRVVVVDDSPSPKGSPGKRTSSGVILNRVPWNAGPGATAAMYTALNYRARLAMRRQAMVPSRGRRLWWRLRNVLCAIAVMKKPTQTLHTRASVTFRKHREVALSGLRPTCWHCRKEELSSTDWYRCNVCSDPPRDLCRGCFRAWAHHEHTFTEMSKASFRALLQRKAKYLITVLNALRTKELASRVAAFPREASLALAHVLGDRVRGRRDMEDVEAVARWVMKTSACRVVEPFLRAAGWEGGGAGKFRADLSAEAARQLRADLLRGTRPMVEVADSDATPLRFHEPMLGSIAVWADARSLVVTVNDVRSKCTPIKEVIVHPPDDPEVVTFPGPPPLSIPLPRGPECPILLTHLRGLCRAARVRNNIPHLVPQRGVGEDSDEDSPLLPPPASSSGPFFVPGDPLNTSRKAAVDYTPYAGRVVRSEGSFRRVAGAVAHMEAAVSRRNGGDEDRAFASKASAAAAEIRAARREGSSGTLKKRRSFGPKSLFDTIASIANSGMGSVPFAKELDGLRKLMEALIEAIKTAAQMVSSIGSGGKPTQVSLSALIDQVLQEKESAEGEACREATAQLQASLAAFVGDTRLQKKEMVDKEGQWCGLTGWEAANPRSRLRSGRVAFSADDLTCHATTRHDTVALGKEVMSPHRAKWYVVEWKVQSANEGVYPGVAPPATGVFDRDTTKKWGLLWRCDGQLFHLGSGSPFAHTARYGTGDRVKIKLMIVEDTASPPTSRSPSPVPDPEGDDGFGSSFRSLTPKYTKGVARLYINNILVHQLYGVRGPLVPYVCFNHAADVPITLKPIREINIDSSTMAKAPTPVLRIVRNLEQELMKAQDCSLVRPPPRGTVTLVFTDVQSSTQLWEVATEGMKVALGQHNRVLRRLIEKWRGYEVKTEGDAFMIAFSRTELALNWCMESQRELMKVAWPEEVLKHSFAGEVKDEGQRIFRGLRVRMGFHTGEPDCEQDPVTGRMDYFGPMVNLAARISGVGKGGETVIGGAAFRHLHRSGALPNPSVFLHCHGTKSLKGIMKTENLFTLLPAELKGRKAYWEAEEKEKELKASQAAKEPEGGAKKAKEKEKEAVLPSSAAFSIARTVAKVRSRKQQQQQQQQESEKERLEKAKQAQEKNEPRWVRTVWRQAAARASRHESGRIGESQLDPVRKKLLLRLEKQAPEQELQLKVATALLETHERLLMEMHDSPKVKVHGISGKAAHLNGRVGTVSHWGKEGVEVNFPALGMLLFDPVNLEAVPSNVRWPDTVSYPSRDPMNAPLIPSREDGGGCAGGTQEAPKTIVSALSAKKASEMRQRSFELAVREASLKKQEEDNNALAAELKEKQAALQEKERELEALLADKAKQEPASSLPVLRNVDKTCRPPDPAQGKDDVPPPLEVAAVDKALEDRRKEMAALSAKLRETETELEKREGDLRKLEALCEEMRQRQHQQQPTLRRASSRTRPASSPPKREGSPGEASLGGTVRSLGGRGGTPVSSPVGTSRPRVPRGGVVLGEWETSPDISPRLAPGGRILRSTVVDTDRASSPEGQDDSGNSPISACRRPSSLSASSLTDSCEGSLHTSMALKGILLPPQASNGGKWGQPVEQPRGKRRSVPSLALLESGSDASPQASPVSRRQNRMSSPCASLSCSRASPIASPRGASRTPSERSGSRSRRIPTK